MFSRSAHLIHVVADESRVVISSTLHRRIEWKCETLKKITRETSLTSTCRLKCCAESSILTRTLLFNLICRRRTTNDYIYSPALACRCGHRHSSNAHKYLVVSRIFCYRIIDFPVWNVNLSCSLFGSIRLNFVSGECQDPHFLCHFSSEFKWIYIIFATTIEQNKIPVRIDSLFSFFLFSHYFVYLPVSLPFDGHKLKRRTNVQRRPNIVSYFLVSFFRNNNKILLWNWDTFILNFANNSRRRMDGERAWRNEKY